MLGTETYWNLMRDPAHLGFELTLEAVTAVIGFFVGRIMLRRHDKTHHVHEGTVEAWVRRSDREKAYDLGVEFGKRIAKRAAELAAEQNKHPNPMNHYGFPARKQYRTEPMPAVGAVLPYEPEPVFVQRERDEQLARDVNRPEPFGYDRPPPFKMVENHEGPYYCGIGDCKAHFRYENARLAHRQLNHWHG